MNILHLKNNIYKYLLTISVLFVILFVLTFTIGDKEKFKRNNSIVKSNISDINEEYSIDVDYPRYKSDSINSVITKYVYEYVKKFKKDKTLNRTLKIDYELYNKNDYTNIVFNIDNSISKVNRHNIIIDLKNEKEASIAEMFSDLNIDKTINEIAYNKYSSKIYEKILSAKLNDYTYIIDDNQINIYFDDIDFGDIPYEPVIFINLNEKIYSFKEFDYDENKKFISLTFDDGPSKYTEEVLKTLELNESSATFFMIGRNMLDNNETVLKVYNSNSEIGNHGYSHKLLTDIPLYELDFEITEFERIFEEITNDKVKYLRPAYGEYNETVRNFIDYPIVLWNVDPVDWNERDIPSIYNEVLKNACDGCIVILHDIYEETNETVKLLVPMLKSLDYEVVSISNLLKYKNMTYNQNDIISKVGD